MGRQPPDFAIVVHGDTVDLSTIWSVISECRVSALNIMTFTQWLDHRYNPEYQVLFIKDSGEVLHAKSPLEKAHIRRQIELLTRRTEGSGDQ